MRHSNINDQYLINALKASVQTKQELINTFVKDNLLLEQELLRTRAKLVEYERAGQPAQYEQYEREEREVM